MRTFLQFLATWLLLSVAGVAFLYGLERQMEIEARQDAAWEQQYKQYGGK